MKSLTGYQGMIMYCIVTHLLALLLIRRNPIGRTGMISRGLLGKWGPNHAADPVVTRYYKNKDHMIVT